MSVEDNKGVISRFPYATETPFNLVPRSENSRLRSGRTVVTILAVQSRLAAKSRPTSRDLSLIGSSRIAATTSGALSGIEALAEPIGPRFPQVAA